MTSDYRNSPEPSRPGRVGHGSEGREDIEKGDWAVWLLPLRGHEATDQQILGSDSRNHETGGQNSKNKTKQNKMEASEPE